MCYRRNPTIDEYFKKTIKTIQLTKYKFKLFKYFLCFDCSFWVSVCVCSRFEQTKFICEKYFFSAIFLYISLTVCIVLSVWRTFRCKSSWFWHHKRLLFFLSGINKYLVYEMRLCLFWFLENNSLFGEFLSVESQNAFSESPPIAYEMVVFF